MCEPTATLLAVLLPLASIGVGAPLDAEDEDDLLVPAPDDDDDGGCVCVRVSIHTSVDKRRPSRRPHTWEHEP